MLQTPGLPPPPQMKQIRMIIPTHLGISENAFPPEFKVLEPFHGTDDKHIIAFSFTVDGIENFIPLTAKSLEVVKQGLEMASKYPLQTSLVPHQTNDDTPANG
jgi:hypothetical protein